MLNNLIKKNFVLIDQAIYSGSSFALTLVLGRVLGIGTFGLFSTFILALFLVTSISNALLVQPMQTRVAELKTKTNYTRFLFSAALVFTFFVGLVVLIVAIIAKFYWPNHSNTVLAFGLYLCFFLLHDFLRKYYLAKGEEKNTLIIDSGYTLLLLLSVVHIYINSITNLEEIFLLLSICFVPFVVYAFHKNLDFKTKDNASTDFPNYHLKEGKWFLLASVSQWFSSNIFVMSSGVFLSIEALGALRLVQTVFGLLNIFLQSVENYIIPKVNLLISDSIVDAQNYLNQLLKKSLWVFLPVLVTIYFFSSEVMNLIGGTEYTPYHGAIKGFAILYLIIFLFYPIRILIRALAFNKSFFVAYLISLVFGLLSSNLLLQHFGLNGAIIGFIGSQLILFTVWLIFLTNQKIQLWKLYI